jgi:hypothetical protein
MRFAAHFALALRATGLVAEPSWEADQYDPLQVLALPSSLANCVDFCWQHMPATRCKNWRHGPLVASEWGCGRWSQHHISVRDTQVLIEADSSTGVHAMESGAGWLVPQLACHLRAGRRHLT